MPWLPPSSQQDSLWSMLYQLNYEANVCLVSFVPSRQSLVNAISAKLWSKCLPCLLRPIKTFSGTCYINWTMKQMPALSPSSNQDSLWYMLHNWTVKQMYVLYPSSFQDSLWSMLYQLNYEANVCLVSFRVMLYQLNNEANVCFVSFI